MMEGSGNGGGYGSAGIVKGMVGWWCKVWANGMVSLARKCQYPSLGLFSMVRRSTIC